MTSRDPSGAEEAPAQPGATRSLGTSGLLSPYEVLRLSLLHPQLAIGAALDRASHARPRFPRVLNVYLTDRCNFACPMCALGEARKERLRVSHADVPVALFAQVARDARRRGAYLLLSGGEPLLHSELGRLLQITRDLRVVTYLTTNGFLLADNAELLASGGLQVLQISLDGWDDASQFERGHVKGAYSAIKAGLAELRASHGHGPFPIVRAVTTITKTTVGHLDEIQAALVELGITKWQVSNYFFATRDVLSAHQRFHAETGFGANLALDVIDDDHFLDVSEVAMLRDSLGLIAGKCRQDGIRLEYAWGTDLDRYYSPAPPSACSRCTSIDAVIEVRPDGRLSVCNDAVTVGDLYSETIEEAWRGETMKRFLKTYHERGILPMCFRCCGICQANAVRF